MAIDLYASCPCGSGKKLKFCCGDLAADLEKIHRKIEGDQPRAALSHLEQVLAKSPRRGSLLDIKATIELSLDELDAAGKTIQRYLEAEPQNPAAHALAATLAAAEAGTIAVEPLQDALELVTDSMPRRVLQAIGAVGHALLVEGSLIAARAHLWLYHGVAGEEDLGAMKTLLKLNQVAGLPLLLRDQLYLQEPPLGVAWEAAHDRAQLLASRGQWRRAAALFEQLANDHPDEPGLLYNAGLVSGWLGRNAQFVSGLRRFAELTAATVGVTDDAIEAEAVAQMLDATGQDAAIDVVRLTYDVADETVVLDRFARDPHFSAYQLEESELATIEGPPPRHTLSLLDRPLPVTGEAITAEQTPRVVGFVSYYGRQTDRPERLEVVLDRDDRFEINKQMLAEVLGEGLGASRSEESVGEAPAVETAMSIRWQFPADTPLALRRELIEAERRRVLLEVWPNKARAVFGGKTPVEAGGDPAMRTALEAAVLNLEQGSAGRIDTSAFAELRERVGLTPPAPLDASAYDAEMTPLSRMHRIDMAQVTDDDLVLIYRRAMMCGANDVVIAVATAAIERPENPRLPREELFHRLASFVPDPAEAIGWIDRARSEAEAAGRSSAAWDIAELEVRVVAGELEEANRLVQHLRSDHLNEPGVAEQLYKMLYALGAAPAPGQAAPIDSPPPPPVSPAASGSKIWTPDDDSPGSGAGQKLWTPS
ncbi:SEC-C domain-containing protein [Botrimarina hoheduenensis]|uniref:SEC-C motif protein n=1 Tax=Botrimarina hoheduenensis TaxID=2528000 RepID=A0A5C5WA43_9BACT|nr:SEC-C domain-containing protein [Botrimarina hoheduenensis]TWT46901.1 hypothetical protein Pla111_20030 [Botrimarina hoheduenensis]